MFDFLRRLIIPIIVVVLVFFTAMIILEWGAGVSSRSDFETSNLAAMINGQEISWQEYNAIYNNIYQAQLAQTEDELSDEVTAQIQQAAWQQLLETTILMQQVEQHNITVSDQEVYQYLRYSPPQYLQQAQFFQTDGKFDYQKYIAAMEDPSTASFWAQVEPEARRELAIYKLQDRITQAAHVSEKEVEQHFLGSTEQVTLGYVNIGLGQYAAVPPQPTDDQVKAYFDEHQAEFQLEDRSELEYVILESKPTSVDWENTFNRANILYDSLVNGADFAEFAKRYSDDGSAENGGDLGWFGRGQMVDAFDKQSFAMSPNDICKPIRTEFGWHIIKLLEYRDETGKVGVSGIKAHEAHAAHILLKVEVSRETIEDNYRRIVEFHGVAKESSFEQAAEELNLIVRKTGLFQKNRSVPNLGYNEELNAWIAEAEIGELSEVTELSTGVFVARMLRRLPAGPATLDEARQAVTQRLVREMVLKQCLDSAQVVYAEIQAGATLEKAAAAHGLEYKTTEPFSRNTPFINVDLRKDPAIVAAAFSLREINKISEPVQHGFGVALLKLLAYSEPDLSTFNEKRDSIHNVVLGEKARQVLTAWYQSIVDTSDIQNNIEQLANRDEGI